MPKPELVSSVLVRPALVSRTSRTSRTDGESKGEYKDSPAVIAGLLIPKSCWRCWSCLLRGRREAGCVRWTAAPFNPHSLAVTPLQVFSHLQESRNTQEPNQKVRKEDGTGAAAAAAGEEGSESSVRSSYQNQSSGLNSTVKTLKVLAARVGSEHSKSIKSTKHKHVPRLTKTGSGVIVGSS